MATGIEIFNNWIMSYNHIFKFKKDSKYDDILSAMLPTISFKEQVRVLNSFKEKKLIKNSTFFALDEMIKNNEEKERIAREKEEKNYDYSESAYVVNEEKSLPNGNDYFMSLRIHVWSSIKKPVEVELAEEEKLKKEIENLEQETSDYSINSTRSRNETDFSKRMTQLVSDNENKILLFNTEKELIFKKIKKEKNLFLKSKLERKFDDMRQKEKKRRILNTSDKILNDRIATETEKSYFYEIESKKKRIAYLRKKLNSIYEIKEKQTEKKYSFFIDASINELACFLMNEHPKIIRFLLVKIFAGTITDEKYNENLKNMFLLLLAIKDNPRRIELLQALRPAFKYFCDIRKVFNYKIVHIN